MSPPLHIPWPRALALAITLLTLAACSDTAGRAASSLGVVGDETQKPAAPVSELTAADVVIDTQPWTFDAKPGRQITTVAYRIHTTLPDARLSQRFPLFMENALAFYTRGITTLPEPSSRMDTFLMADRAQWATLTQRILGSEAQSLLRVDRGGFSSRGRSLLFDLGGRDTYVIAAHEGWHQYVQTTFGDPLPVWLDEGVATYMEGFRWRSEWSTGPVFKPWTNFERFETLRWAVRGKYLLPLEALMQSKPQELLDRGEYAPLVYYAQVWAFTHFLAEGESGKYRAGFEAILKDAAAGRASARIGRELGSRARSAYESKRDGLGAFHVYFTKDLAAVQAEFDAFVKKVAANGNMQKIVEGRSPVSDQPAEPSPR
jgi:hypothetical protein